MFLSRVAVVGGVLLLLSACSSEVSDSQASDAAAVNVQLGVSYMEQGQLERALKRLERALEFDEESVDAHLAIAHLYVTIEQPALAEKHYRSAIEIAPEQASVLNNFGAFLCSREQFDEAVELFLRAAGSPFYQTPEAAWSNAGICAFQAGDVDEAEEYLRRAVNQSPNFASALITLAELYYQRQDYFRARAFAERYASAGRLTPEFLMLGYRIEESLNNTEGQNRYQQRLFAEFPNSAQAQRLAGGEELE
jgi:type IV pilus assembly protein PilF